MDLPIYLSKNELLTSIQNNKVTIVCGETGSGKSTQLPQYLLQIISRDKMIACTQPRRVAAITIASRVANERKCHVGTEVGYTIRFEDKTSSSTRIKYVTDGVLLREIMTDTELSKYAIIILDEAHERSLQTDILLGLLKQLLQRRDDLRSYYTETIIIIV
jgi:HrpA-like RNA helicase